MKVVYCQVQVLLGVTVCGRKKRALFIELNFL